MKKIAILGASGSIGMSTIEVIRRHPECFELVAFSVYTHVACIAPLLDEFKTVKMVACKSLKDVESFRMKYPMVQFFEKEEGINAVATCPCDLCVNAIVGFAGLKPTLKAIENHTDIALANKETLVVAGEMIMKKAKENHVKIFPIDSEHSAIFQCLEKNNPIHKILLTASGGPFFQKSEEELKKVTLQDALKHPNWKMGNKITIDSATMFNKAFEVIEAKWLFDVNPSQIEVIIHPQSLVHSMVEFIDGSIKAQLGVPDMKMAIAYALNDQIRLEHIANFLDFHPSVHMDFYLADKQQYLPLKLAYQALKEQGTYPAVMNAANEEAVHFFLEGRIQFIDIFSIVEKTLAAHTNIEKELTLEDVYQADGWAREYVRRMVS